MKIQKVTTLAFAVSEKKEQDAEKKFISGTEKVLGIIAKEKPEIRKGYFPLVDFKLDRLEMVHKGITQQTTYKRKENNFFVNLTNGKLYHITRKKIEGYDLLNKVLDKSKETVRTLGNLIRSGETLREDLDSNIVMELASLGLIKIYKPAFKELYTLVIDDLVSEPEGRHTLVKERVDLNFHIPRFDDPDYNLSDFLLTTNTMVESYLKEPIKYSVDQIADILKDLFQAEVTLTGITFLPYIRCSYTKKRKETSKRISEFLFPVCFKDQKEIQKGGIEIKPISLSTEIGALRAVPIERETINFSDVANLEEIKKEIKEEIIYPIMRPDLAKDYGRKGGGSILLYGPTGCGKTYIAKATIGECGASFYNINISDLVKQGFEEGAKALHEIFELASKNSPSIIFFDEFDAIGGKKDPKQEEAERMLIDQLLTEMDGVESLGENVLFIAATNAPWAIDPALRRSERFTKQLFISPPDLNARIEIFKIHTRDKPISPDIDFEKLAELTENFASSDIKAICDKAAEIPWEEALKGKPEREITMEDFLEAIKSQKSSLTPWFKTAYKKIKKSGEIDLYNEYAKYILKYAGGVDQIKKPEINFKDVGNLEKIKNELRNTIIYPIKKPELSKEYGMIIGGGILLYGPPGCGKTYITRATAGECDASFFNVRITDILSPKEGESEKNLSMIFERASRNTPAILFFDEIDSITIRRDISKDSRMGLINAFLTEMDGFKKTKGLVVIAATNAPWAIDPALRRSERFTKQLFISPPDLNARIEIFKIHTRDKPISPDIDFEKLAELTENFASSDIKAICDKAAEIPWEEALKGKPEREITMEDFLEAIKSQKSSLTPWFKMAKKEIEKSGEEEVYDELYKSILDSLTKLEPEKFKEILIEEKAILSGERELKDLGGKKKDLKDKIKIVQDKFNTGEISQESFRNIIGDYEKQLIDLDAEIKKLKAKKGLKRK